MVSWLEVTFPLLSQTGYQVTSEKSKIYNCIAWAAGDTERWWWPLPEIAEVYWPAGAPRSETLDAFRAAFATLGYGECDQDHAEVGFQKIALFADPAKI